MIAKVRVMTTSMYYARSGAVVTYRVPPLTSTVPLLE